MTPEPTPPSALAANKQLAEGVTKWRNARDECERQLQQQIKDTLELMAERDTLAEDNAALRGTVDAQFEQTEANKRWALRVEAECNKYVDAKRVVEAENAALRAERDYLTGETRRLQCAVGYDFNDTLKMIEADCDKAGVPGDIEQLNDGFARANRYHTTDRVRFVAERLAAAQTTITDLRAREAAVPGLVQGAFYEGWRLCAEKCKRPDYPEISVEYDWSISNSLIAALALAQPQEGASE